MTIFLPTVLCEWSKLLRRIHLSASLAHTSSAEATSNGRDSHIHKLFCPVPRSAVKSFLKGNRHSGLELRRRFCIELTSSEVAKPSIPIRRRTPIQAPASNVCSILTSDLHTRYSRT